MRTQVLLLGALCLLLSCKKMASFRGNYLDSGDRRDSGATLPGAVAVKSSTPLKTETKRVAEERRAIDILLVLDSSDSMYCSSPSIEQ